LLRLKNELAMKTVLSLLLAGFALAYSGASLAGDTEAGKSKSSFSNGCHGANRLDYHLLLIKQSSAVSIAAGAQETGYV